MNSVRSKNLNLKYQRFTSSSWEDVGAYRFLVRGKNSVPLNIKLNIKIYIQIY